jgi:hypothetical protein
MTNDEILNPNDEEKRRPRLRDSSFLRFFVIRDFVIRHFLRTQFQATGRLLQACVARGLRLP